MSPEVKEPKLGLRFQCWQQSSRPIVCRQAGATAGSQVETITIQLPDVEAAMLVEVQKRNNVFKDLQHLLIQQIRQEYQKTSGGSVR